MILEEQRFLHEDIERLEQAISDRILDEPATTRERLRKEHQIARYVDRIEGQSKKLLRMYSDRDTTRSSEIDALAATGGDDDDDFGPFYARLAEIKDFHRRYPNERVENLELTYRKPGAGEPVPAESFVDIENMFTGEEGFGKFFDLTRLHDRYVNLPAVKGGRRVSYLQYLDLFDVFVPPKCPTKRVDKVRDSYVSYVTDLADYLDSFIRRTRPLDNLDAFFAQWEDEFQTLWREKKIPGWTGDAASNPDAAAADAPDSDPLWCQPCQKRFANENLFNHHLEGKKHKRAAATAADGQPPSNQESKGTSTSASASTSDREEAVARTEFRVQKLAKAMQIVRDDTKVNVERKQVLTDRERAHELAALQAELADAPTRLGSKHRGGNSNRNDGTNNADDNSDSDDDRIYNPLKLPISWDGKPIPYWLYKLHGLGVEFRCEICGNFVYMGRRAFDKHFNEARHLSGLKCLGITDATLFREVILIDDAIKLQAKIKDDKSVRKKADDGVVQMEDADGNVMPEKVYYDLQKQGLL